MWSCGVSHYTGQLQLQQSRHTNNCHNIVFTKTRHWSLIILWCSMFPPRPHKKARTKFELLASIHLDRSYWKWYEAVPRSYIRDKHFSHISVSHQIRLPCAFIHSCFRSSEGWGRRNKTVPRSERREYWWLNGMADGERLPSTFPSFWSYWCPIKSRGSW